MSNNTKAIETAAKPVEVIRKAEDVAKLLSFDELKGTALFTKGAQLSARELGGYAASQANAAESANLRAVAALRIAKNLPDIDTPKASGEGTYKRKAFDVACEYCASQCKTPSTWQNIRGLIAAVEVSLANGEIEPYKLKNSLGYLNALGVIDEKTLKIKDSAKSDVGVKAILDKTVKATAVLPQLTEAKRAHNAQAIAEGKEVPFPVQLSKDQKEALAKAEAEKAKLQAGGTDVVGSVARQITTVIGLWQKTVDADSANIAKLRTACAKEIEALAKLGGYKLVSL
jgi:hypothetical protein